MPAPRLVVLPVGRSTVIGVYCQGNRPITVGGIYSNLDAKFIYMF